MPKALDTVTTQTFVQAIEVSTYCEVRNHFCRYVYVFVV